MLNLIRIELLKIVPNRTLWIFLLAYGLLLFAILSFISSLNLNVNGAKIGTKMLFDFPAIWHNVAYIASFLYLILGFTIITFITNEFSFRTLRQNVIDGLKRSEILFGKIGLIFLLAIFSSILVFLASLVFGWLLATGENTTPIFEQLGSLGTFFLQMVAYMSLATLIAFVVKRSGLSYIFFILASSIEGIATAIIRRQLPELTFTKYLPMNAISSLVPNPFTDNLKSFGVPIQEIPLNLNIALVVFYILLFWGLSYWLLQKKDL